MGFLNEALKSAEERTADTWAKGVQRGGEYDGLPPDEAAEAAGFEPPREGEEVSTFYDKREKVQQAALDRHAASNNREKGIVT